MNNDLLYQVALTRVPNIGDVLAKSLIAIYGDAQSIFRAPKKELEKTEAVGTVRAAAIKNFHEFKACEDEIRFMEKYDIRPLFINEDAYPRRLLNCYDSPVLLYYRGIADLNADKIVAVVGTRNHSDYGRQLCEKIVAELAEEKVLIVSGLAFGIDTIAHRAALKNNLETVGVLAHGLDRIYPYQNNQLAGLMTGQGGLLTDFGSGNKPDKQNFPRRNRIVAGMCDALIVIESGKKGGSLITAELANSYNKDVFAIPGRTIDVKSEGCNQLIRNNKASLVTGTADLMQLMNWTAQPPKKAVMQKQLFIELSTEEKKLVALLQKKATCHIDELFLAAELSSSAMAAALLSLEMQGIISSMPGKVYRMD